MKKTILWIIAVIILFVIIVSIYYLSGCRKEESTSTPTDTKNVEEIITDNKIYFPALSESGKEILYFSGNEEGYLYSQSLENGQITKVSEQIKSPEEITWSPQRDKAIICFLEEEKGVSYQVYDLNTKKFYDLDSHIQNVAWAVSGEKIIYDYYSYQENINNISISDPDGSSWNKLIDIEYGEGVGFVPYAIEEIYYYPRLTEIGGDKIFQLNIKSGLTKEVIKEDIASGALADSNGNLIFNFYHQESESYTLAVLPKGTQNIIDLEIKSEIDNIGIFNQENSAIVAVSQDGNSDKLYQIDLTNGDKKEIIFSSADQVNIYNLILSPNNEVLYFTSDNYLHKINL